MEKNDIRFRLILSNCKWVKKPVIGWQYICEGEIINKKKIYVNNCVSVPEMFLIRAECNSRLAKGKLSDIVADLNTLRVNRFVTGTYISLTSGDFSTKSEALTFVLEERRREMVMTGMRLFDLKRLNIDPNYAKTVTHTVEGKVYTIVPGANNLVLPIPAQVLNLAPGLTQNPRD